MIGRKRMNRRKRQRGFTLIEILAVVVIIGLIAGVVTVGIISQVNQARIRTTATQISQLGQAVATFNLECGYYPSTMADLRTAPSSGRPCKGYPAGGFLSKDVPNDAWGNPYNYVAPGVHDPQGYDLWSNGPDGEEGSSDDVSSWK